jgi:4-aminobutyrate aminotransferase
MGVTGNRGWSPSSLGPFSVHYAQRLPAPLAVRNLDDAVVEAYEDLRNVIETTTSGDVATMIAEPIQGVGGFCVPPDGFFGAMKKVLDEYEILFISDEVQTGWGRTGEHFWGYEAHGVLPDALTFAKGLGNGLAIAGSSRGDLMDAMPANSLSTFGGNPLVTAGAWRTSSTCSTTTCRATRARGSYLLERLRPLADRCAMVAEVRGRGLMIGIELVEEDGTRRAQRAARPRSLQGRRWLVGKGGLYGNCLRVAPPLSISLEEAEEGAAVIADALTRLSG